MSNTKEDKQIVNITTWGGGGRATMARIRVVGEYSARRITLLLALINELALM